MDMAIATPRGLRIRLSVDHAFTLLGRLYEADHRATPFKVLKTCEAIELVPVTLMTLAGVLAVLLGSLPAWTVSVFMVVARVLGLLLTSSGVFIVLRPSGALLLARAFSYINGYGLIWIFACVMAFFRYGWMGVGAWVAGQLLATACSAAIQVVLVRRAWLATGQPLTQSEVNFVNAYRLHADDLGLTRDITVEDEEVATGIWKAAFLHYASHWPEAVARFRADAHERALIGSVLNSGATQQREF